MDREKVIYDIERCICHVPDACRDCSHYGHGEVIGCMEELLKDALKLLKEQEKELLEFIGAVAKLTAENEMLKMIYGNPGEIVGELVRCKDCKYYDSFSQECRNGIDGIMTPNFYCGNAERKEGR